MGKYIKSVFIIFFILILTVDCFGLQDTYEEFVQNAPEEFSDQSLDDLSNNIGFPQFFKNITSALFEGLKESISLMFSVISVVILFSLVKKIRSDNNSVISSTFAAAVSVTVIALTFSAVKDNVKAISDCIESAKVFCMSSVPVILGLCISSGNSFSGAVFSSSISFITTILENLSHSLLVPLTVLYLSFSVMGNFSSFNILAIDKQIKKFIKWIIGSFVTLFSISMSLQSFLSASADSVLKRSVKGAVGAFIPVVGGTLSSSVDSLFTIASNSKTAFAVLGAVIIVTIFLPAIATCICYGLSMSAAKVFAELVNESKIAKTVQSVADTFYLLSGISCACITMMILSFLIICINLN